MGAQTTLYLAYEDNNKLIRGGYYKDCRVKQVEGLANYEGIDKRIMIYTKNLIENNIKERTDLLEKHKKLIDKIEN